MEGNLFTSDHLTRIKTGEVAGIHVKDYHLTGRLDEHISRNWTSLASAWGTFRLKLQAHPEDAEVNGRDYWLTRVFHELGFGIGVLTKKPNPVIDGKKYPINYRWETIPIHVVSPDQDLEEGPDGTARGNPHSVMQEYLNREAGMTWGIVTNGLKLRVLRENGGSSRPCYVEFNLEAMFDGEHFDEFVIFWRFCHGSRFLGEEPWIEKWMRDSARHGVRALETLRRGVEEAITALGNGFLRQRNTKLSKRLDAGELNQDDYYRQVLRLVYRLLFLAVTEDRDLLLLPDTDETRAARRYYADHYSLRRLRDLSRRHKGSKHTDLYEGLKLVMRGLKSPEGIPQLALPGLNSALWGPDFIPDLEEATIANRDLLDAVRHLTFIETRAGHQAIDYVNLGAEELGSVYESLLELHPKVSLRERSFMLTSASGNERKGTGSYYTPRAVIDQILTHALEPLLKEALEKPNQEEALLALKVCDPTCGSGHFLVAAAHRIARKLAQVRTRDEEPTPTALRRALRDVLSHCVYGVDINPMAVELCKVSLWLEAMEPGKPLTFLEHKIQCGNAVIGATPKLLRERIPDAAFEPIEGDDKAACREYRDMNRKQIPAQASLHGFKGINDPEFMEVLREDIRAIEALDDDSVATVQEKERLHEQHRRRQRFAKDYADAWCAAFFQVKQPRDAAIITQETLNLILEDPNLVPQDTWARIESLREEYQFFHWHLAFPEVFALPNKSETSPWAGGFDLVLGNPPWDTLSPETREFFGRYDPDIGKKDKDGQAASIGLLLQDSAIAAEWTQHRRHLYAAVNFYKQSGRFELFAPGNLGKGDFNIFRMLVELGLRIARREGYYSQVLPENFYLGANCAAIRKEVFENYRLDCLYGFINANEAWFSGVHSQTKFCIIVVRRGGQTERFLAVFNLQSEEDLLRARDRMVSVPVKMVKEFSPEALQIAELQDSREVTIANKMYERCPKFGERSGYYDRNPYMAELHMGTHRSIFRKDGKYPLYQGRMVQHYDHRAQAYSEGRGRASKWEELPFGMTKSIQPQWYIREGELPEKLRERVNRYRVAFCDVANPDNERSLTTTIVPPGVVCGDKVPTILLRSQWMHALLVGVANSISLDWLARTKVSRKMSFTTFDSLPVPNLPENSRIVHEIVGRVARLVCVGEEMQELWDALMTEGFLKAPRHALVVEDPGARHKLECEIHAIVAKHIYGLTRDEFEHQFASFGVLHRKEDRAHGEFRTKLWSLAAYDALPKDFPRPTTAELWGPEAGGRTKPRTLFSYAEE